MNKSTKGNKTFTNEWKIPGSVLMKRFPDECDNFQTKFNGKFPPQFILT